MTSGKHSSDGEIDFEGIPFKKIGIIFLVLIVVTGVVYGAYRGVSWWKENKKVEEVVADEEETPKMIETIEGYNVLGKIIIEDLNIEQYILDSIEDEALENGVGKLYGGDLNDYGNFCIAGHNYEEVFQKLEELEEGDTFYILDKNLEKTYYEIKEIDSVEPDDLTCLLQNEELIEMTLITCENASTTRLVIKAEMIEESDIKESGEPNSTNTVESENTAEENVLEETT